MATRTEAPSQQAKAVVPATIKAGEWLSTSVTLTTNALAMVFAPDQWTPANISFQVSYDNTHWVDLFDADGAELLKPIAAGTAVNVDTSLTQAALYLRLRSGPRSAPVPQAQDAVFTLVCI